jgi:hypothetical protein
MPRWKAIFFPAFRFFSLRVSVTSLTVLPVLGLAIFKGSTRVLHGQQQKSCGAVNTRVKTLCMPRPTLGKQRKKDVTLTLDQEIMVKARAYCRGKRISISSLVDELLEREMDSGKGALPFRNVEIASQVATSPKPSKKKLSG